jgi:chemotaxis protein CheX
MTATLTLPSVLDIQAAEPLRVQLLANRGQDVVLDASNVERLGALCLQVLISAQQSWAREGRTVAIEQASESFANQWNMFGAPPTTAGPGESA